MKKVFSLLFAFLAGFALLMSSACSNDAVPPDEEQVSAAPQVSFGIPAEQLTAEERQLYESYIADYAEYIRSVVCELKVSMADYADWDLTIVIDRFYLYDFSKVQTDSLSEDEKSFFDSIEEYILPDCKTIVCCGGFLNYYSDNIWSPIASLARIPDMFAGDTSFAASYLRVVFGLVYSYHLPDQTRVIDFGDAFSFRFSPTYEQARTFTPDYKTLSFTEIN